MGATSGATLDFDDEISGGYKGIQSVLEGGDFSEGYNKGRDNYRRAKDRIRGESPGLSLAGEALSGLATPALGAAKGASTLARGALTGAGLGGLSGAGNAKETKDIPLDVLKAALLGGVMGAGGSAMNSSPKRGVVANTISHAPDAPITLPVKEPSMKRSLQLADGNFTHQVFDEGGSIYHFLVDEKTGKAVATLSGNMVDSAEGPGLSVGWSRATGGKGHGKKLYDLALDTHQKVYSDVSLSPEGSHRVYKDHFSKTPGVDVKLAPWNTMERHKVDLKDPMAFHKEKQFPPFSPEYSSVRKRLEERTTGKAAEGYLDQGNYVPPRPSQRSRASLRTTLSQAEMNQIRHFTRGDRDFSYWSDITDEVYPTLGSDVSREAVQREVMNQLRRGAANRYVTRNRGDLEELRKDGMTIEEKIERLKEDGHSLAEARTIIDEFGNRRFQEDIAQIDKDFPKPPSDDRLYGANQGIFEKMNRMYGKGYEDADMMDYLLGDGRSSKEAKALIEDFRKNYREPGWDKFGKGSDSEVLTKGEKAWQDFANSDSYPLVSEMVDSMRRSGRNNAYIIQELIDAGMNKDIAKQMVEYGF